MNRTVQRVRREQRQARQAAWSRPYRWFRRLLTALIVLVVLVILVAGAGIGLLYWQGVRAPTGKAQYVALGSSFAAGPGVGQQAPNSPALCLRSATNYPHLVAQALHLDLTDVTCSGATAVNVLDGGQFFQPPQVNALKPTTQLVTVTIGGNDVNYLGNLFAWSCQHDPADVPFLWSHAGPCTVTSDAKVDTERAALPARLDQIAQQVHQRSPHARLVFVDYTTILPDSGSCPTRLPITDTELQRARLVATHLVADTAAAAQRNSALLAQVSRATHGHDICSADPWVFGFTFSGSPLQYGPLAYHPTQKAMQGAANAILKVLDTTLIADTIRA